MKKTTHTRTELFDSKTDKLVLYTLTSVTMLLTIFIMTLNPENISMILFNIESNTNVDNIYHLILGLLLALILLFTVTIYLDAENTRRRG